MNFIKEHRILSPILAYIFLGCLYWLVGEIEHLILGKEITFSPLISLPLTVTGWPWMVYADLKNIGWKVQDGLTLVFLALFLYLFIRSFFLGNEDRLSTLG